MSEYTYQDGGTTGSDKSNGVNQEQAAIELATKLFAAPESVKEEKPAGTRKSDTLKFRTQRDPKNAGDNQTPAGRAIEAILSTPPVSEGGRHADILSRSLQLRANGWTDESIYTAITQIYPIGSGEGRRITEKEIRDAIRGASLLPLTPTGAGGGHGQPVITAHNGKQEPPKPTVRQYEPTGEGEALPQDLIQTTPFEFLRRFFNPDELLCVTFPDETGKPNGTGWTFYVEQLTNDEFLKQSLPERCESGKGVWFTINPLKADSNHRHDADIADFRHLLVELDNGPKEVQFANLKNSGLPIAALYDSGNKSIHALVKVDAKDIEEFRKRQKIVYDYLRKLGIDTQNGNPSRLSRLPGCKRGDNRQQLYTWDVGANNWDEWFENAEIDDGLPEIETPDMFLSKRMDLDPYLIHGLLRENSKMNFTSQSKGRKTWMLLHMALCIGSGTPWLGHKCERAPVLFVNFELKRNGANNRVFDVCKAMGISPVTGHDVDFWNLRGKAADIAVMVQHIGRRLRHRQYKVVVLDPAYKCLGNRDENKAGDITDFCNHLEKIATEFGATTITTGHTTKGSQEGKAANDLQSGSGVWARDPDVVASFLTCTDEAIVQEHGEDVVTVQFSGMREDATPSPFAAKWRFPIFKLIKDVVPQRTQKKNGRPKQGNPWDLAAYFKPNEKLTFTVLEERAGREKCKGTTFKRRLQEAKDSGCLVHDVATGIYSVDAARVEKLKASPLLRIVKSKKADLQSDELELLKRAESVFGSMEVAES